jgi:hypothetical protein
MFLVQKFYKISCTLAIYFTYSCDFEYSCEIALGAEPFHSCGT